MNIKFIFWINSFCLLLSTKVDEIIIINNKPRNLMFESNTIYLVHEIEETGYIFWIITESDITTNFHIELSIKFKSEFIKPKKEEFDNCQNYEKISDRGKKYTCSIFADKSQYKYIFFQLNSKNTGARIVFQIQYISHASFIFMIISIILVVLIVTIVLIIMKKKFCCSS